MITLVKKIACDVDNSPEYSGRRVQLYHDIKEHLAAGCSIREISRNLHCGRNTVRKYLQGDFETICRKEHRSRIDEHYDLIIKSLSAGMSRSELYQKLITIGCDISKTSAYDYMNKLIKQHGIEISVYKSSLVEAIKEKKRLSKYDHVTRTGIF